MRWTLRGALVTLTVFALVLLLILHCSNKSKAERIAWDSYQQGLEACESIKADVEAIGLPEGYDVHGASNGKGKE